MYFTALIHSLSVYLPEHQFPKEFGRMEIRRGRVNASIVCKVSGR
jgi:hypothetical protein